MCVRQLEPACLKVLFQCEQLKAEYSEIKCLFLMLKEFLKDSRLPLFGRVWSLKLERFSFDSSVQTDMKSHIMTCASSIIYSFFFFFNMDHPQKRERLYSLVLCVWPSPDEFACGDWAERPRACLFFDEKRRMTGILVLSGNSQAGAVKPPISPF